MKKNKRYILPKYRRGQKVKTVNGDEGHILSITYTSGAHFYRIGEKFYAETEIERI